MIHGAPALPRRQVEFLAMSANGMSRTQIGAAVHLSPFTVKDIHDAARMELGVHSLMEAVVKALALSILVIDDDGRVRAGDARVAEIASR